MGRRALAMSEPSYYILAVLLEGPSHGYGIIKRAAELSDGWVRLPVGTLYGALDRMVEDGLIVVDREETVSGRPRRYFRITEQGRHAVTEEAARLHRAAQVVARHTATRKTPETRLA